MQANMIMIMMMRKKSMKKMKEILSKKNMISEILSRKK